MKYIYVLLLAIMSLSISSATHAKKASEQVYSKISTKSEFNKLVVGKKLWIKKNHIIVNKNGTWSGDFSGKKITGTWKWKNGYWCRVLLTAKIKKDCQLWTVSGKSNKITRSKGKGKTFIYVAK